MDTTTDIARRGRPASKNRLEGMAPAAEEQPVAREIAREPARHGRAVALDRDGKPISRRRDNTEDKFHIPEELKEPGWTYQWNVHSVLGQDDIGAQIRDQENGWRSVPSERPGFAGRFMPDGYKGAIVRDGLRLDERPVELTEEARREDRINANSQRAENRRRFGLPNVPDGFDASHPSLGKYGKGKPGVNVALEGAPRADGKYNMAIDGDE